MKVRTALLSVLLSLLHYRNHCANFLNRIENIEKKPIT
jgi:hypothetical protein